MRKTKVTVVVHFVDIKHLQEIMKQLESITYVSDATGKAIFNDKLQEIKSWSNVS